MVLADCFYEWKKVGTRKVPYRILLKDGAAFAFAGLWDSWMHDGKELRSCLIITTQPNRLVSKIHDRMPVILPTALEKQWLSDVPLDRVGEFLKPFDDTKMISYEVSRDINFPQNDHIGVTKPVHAK
ncbi:MAG: SOS response-associated peptidase [Candidatus Omnitrophota bacterium]